MLNTNHSLIQGIKYEQTFFKKQKYRGYVQKRPTIYSQFKKGNVLIKCVVKPEPSTSALEKGYHTTFSQLKMDWYNVYTETSSHFCMCRIIQIFPD